MTNCKGAAIKNNHCIRTAGDQKSVLGCFIKTANRPLYASQGVLVVKNLPVNAADIRNWGSIPGLGRSPGGGHGNPLQYTCLEKLMDRGAWWATVHVVTKSWIRLKQLSMAQYSKMTPNMFRIKFKLSAMTHKVLPDLDSATSPTSSAGSLTMQVPATLPFYPSVNHKLLLM